VNWDHVVPTQVVQAAARLPLSIPEEKLDFLLGMIKDGPGAAKSARRGYDLVLRLGFDRVRLRELLTSHARDPGLIERAVAVRRNPLGGPLVRLAAPVVSPNGGLANFISVWELGADAFRLITAWAEIHR
jgi:hypothetical protein